MTLQLRPTFSESWYRVKDLKPRLRAAAQISRQFYRGERWYIVRDPAGNQFHRLSDVAYQFVGLLDGTRTVGEAWELVGGQLADDAPTQPEVIQILSQLYGANLIETNIAPDAQVLLRRQKKQRERKFQGRLMNLLFPRIPLWDPDKFLKIWMPLVGPLISKGGMILWLLAVGLALFFVLPNSGAFASQTQNFLSSGAVEMWLLLGVTFLVTKFLHEMGHAFAVRRFGGECHEVGIMFLVLMPCPYVDASTAWGFPSKWRRIFVGAGGMIAEVFIAALAAIIWYVTLGQPGLCRQPGRVLHDAHRVGQHAALQRQPAAALRRVLHPVRLAGNSQPSAEVSRIQPRPDQAVHPACPHEASPCRRRFDRRPGSPSTGRRAASTASSSGSPSCSW